MYCFICSAVCFPTKHKTSHVAANITSYNMCMLEFVYQVCAILQENCTRSFLQDRSQFSFASWSSQKCAPFVAFVVI